MNYRFRLYVVGDGGSQRVVKDLKAALDQSIPGQYRLEVVDLQKQPEIADRDRVIAAPTLVRIAPRPQRRVIGGLSDPGELLAALDLSVTVHESLTPAPA